MKVLSTRALSEAIDRLSAESVKSALVEIVDKGLTMDEYKIIHAVLRVAARLEITRLTLAASAMAEKANETY